MRKIARTTHAHLDGNGPYQRGVLNSAGRIGHWSKLIQNADSDTLRSAGSE